jgi:Ca-activated chloride channel family protein
LRGSTGRFAQRFRAKRHGTTLATGRRRISEDAVKCLTPFAVAALIFSGTAALAQQNNDQPAIFRSGANLVALNVTVTDAKKQFVSGLTQEDFAVYEDGVAQQLRFFEARQVPLDLIVLIDTSSSMRDKMSVVHEAAVGFLKTMRPVDRGAVVAFNDGVDVLQPLTSELPALEQAVRSTQAKGSTSLHNALYIALKQFGRASAADGELRRQAIAVLSDGEDTSSLISFDDVLALARKSGVSIYTIALHSKYSSARSSQPTQRYFSTADFSMKSLAQETGAQSFFPMEVSELKGIYASIAQELASQYAMAYSPANSRPDGRYRRIVVRVTDRPELQLRTRSGYTAEALRSAASFNER